MTATRTFVCALAAGLTIGIAGPAVAGDTLGGICTPKRCEPITQPVFGPDPVEPVSQPVISPGPYTQPLTRCVPRIRDTYTRRGE